jgi:hypothetical protein
VGCHHFTQSSVFGYFVSAFPAEMSHRVFYLACGVLVLVLTALGGPRFGRRSSASSCPVHDASVIPYASDFGASDGRDRALFARFFRGVCGRYYVDLGNSHSTNDSATWFFYARMGWTGTAVKGDIGTALDVQDARPGGTVFLLEPGLGEGWSFVPLWALAPALGPALGSLHSAIRARMPSLFRIELVDYVVDAVDPSVLNSINTTEITVCVFSVLYSPVNWARNLEVDMWLYRMGYTELPWRVSSFWVTHRCPEYSGARPAPDST